MKLREMTSIINRYTFSEKKIMRYAIHKTTLILLFLLIFLQGCASTQQRRDVEQSGFLGDYSQFEEGGGNEALLYNINPNVDWASYREIMLDPVTVWKDEQTKDVAPEDLQKLTDFLYAKLHEVLSQDYTMVPEPGPGVMRVAVALTEAEASAPVMDTITSFIPHFRLLTGAKGLVVGGKPGFVGSASLEVKLTDSISGASLLEAVDRRAGTKNLSGVTSEWNDVERAYVFWAEKLRWRLCTQRGEENCVEPEE